MVKPPPGPVSLPPVLGRRSRCVLQVTCLRLKVDTSKIQRLTGVLLLLGLTALVMEVREEPCFLVARHCGAQYSLEHAMLDDGVGLDPPRTTRAPGPLVPCKGSENQRRRRQRTQSSHPPEVPARSPSREPKCSRDPQASPSSFIIRNTWDVTVEQLRSSVYTLAPPPSLFHFVITTRGGAQRPDNGTRRPHTTSAGGSRKRS